MQVSVSHSDWRVLREVLRGRGKPVPGAKLRMDMSRRTKDGSHLAALVHFGLLAVAEPADAPYQAAYLLTDLGRHAAEYGVYDRDWETYKTLIETNPAAAEPAKTTPRRRRVRE